MHLNVEGYTRYHIDTGLADEIEKWPTRFNVKVGKVGLAKWLVGEIIHLGWKRKEVILSRPCMYGVFSGPVGGFSPRPQHCVGCLRCTTEYADFCSVTHNPDREELGDSYFTTNYMDAIRYEALEGMIPVKGAGYRGKFGGQGWDGMWTDMSEIVRPTRDGIHGREFISTVIDIGFRPNYLVFDEDGLPTGSEAQVVSLPLPILFDAPPLSVQNETVYTILNQAAKDLQTLSIQPIGLLTGSAQVGSHLVPLVKPAEAELLSQLSFTPQLVEMDGWDENLFQAIQTAFPQAIVVLRVSFPTEEALLEYVSAGVHTFHLTANYHGLGREGKFILDLIREAHKTLVDAGIRQEVSLIGSGGMIAAEHIPKAILCGLDAVALDTPVMAALQSRFDGECHSRENSQFILPRKLNVEWGVQRLHNMSAAWRDQLLEISGAMGLREIRRMRGEMGRAMFMKELETSAFAGVTGYEG